MLKMSQLLNLAGLVQTHMFVCVCVCVCVWQTDSSGLHPALYCSRKCSSLLPHNSLLLLLLLLSTHPDRPENRQAGCFTNSNYTVDQVSTGGSVFGEQGGCGWQWKAYQFAHFACWELQRADCFCLWDLLLGKSNFSMSCCHIPLM